MCTGINVYQIFLLIVCIIYVLADILEGLKEILKKNLTDSDVAFSFSVNSVFRRLLSQLYSCCIWVATMTTILSYCHCFFNAIMQNRHRKVLLWFLVNNNDFLLSREHIICYNAFCKLYKTKQ